MGLYYLDPKAFSLEKFKHGLISRDLLPGRRILLENIDSNFSILESAGYCNLSDILTRLKTKKKIETESKELDISVEYLTILKREAGSFIPKLVSLDTFIEVENDGYLEVLLNHGYKNTQNLFEAAYTRKDRKELATQLNIPYALLTKWVQICDLLRINGVGPVFAIILWESGVYSCQHFISTPEDDLLDNVNMVIETKFNDKHKLRRADVIFCKEFLKELPIILE